MKKLFILAAVVIASLTTASAQHWGVGGRLGSNFSAIGQYEFASKDYVEVRLGMNLISIPTADFSALYNWNCLNMQWTPKGNWFFDAGVGLYVGGTIHLARVGVQGVAKLGYTFDFPLSLAFDFSPSVGPNIAYGTAENSGSRIGYDVMQLANFGVSAVYRF